MCPEHLIRRGRSETHQWIHLLSRQLSSTDRVSCQYQPRNLSVCKQGRHGGYSALREISDLPEKFLITANGKNGVYKSLNSLIASLTVFAIFHIKVRIRRDICDLLLVLNALSLSERSVWLLGTNSSNNFQVMQCSGLSFLHCAITIQPPGQFRLTMYPLPYFCCCFASSN